MEVSSEPLQSSLDTLSKLCDDVVKVEFRYLAEIRSCWDQSKLPLPERKKEVEAYASKMAEEKEAKLEQFLEEKQKELEEKEKEERRRLRKEKRKEMSKQKREEGKENPSEDPLGKKKSAKEEGKMEVEQMEEEQKEEEQMEVEQKEEKQKEEEQKNRRKEVKDFGVEGVKSSAGIQNGDDSGNRNESLNRKELTDKPKSSNPPLETKPHSHSVIPSNPSDHSSIPANAEVNKTKLENEIQTFFEFYSLLPSDLVSMATDLDSVFTSNQPSLDTYRILKEESWQLQSILNRVAFQRDVIQTCAQQLIHRIQSYHNPDCEIVMRNYVAKRLIEKGMESTEPTVCMSFSFLLAELASLDPLFVNMIMGQLYKQCPQIRLEVPESGALSAEKFESVMMKHSMVIRLFAGLFLMNSRSFPVEFAWKWIRLFVQLADCTHFLEAPQNLEAFLETCGFLLQRDGARFAKLLKHINEITIPSLSDVPSFTSGSIARLKILVSDGHTFTDLYTHNLSSVCDKQSIHCTNLKVPGL